MRLHLFEIEDQAWYPDSWRKGQTIFLRWMMGTFTVFDRLMPLLVEKFHASGHRQWIDLCSGGGGALLQLRESFMAGKLPFKVLLTDLYPNTEAFDWLAEATNGECQGWAQPVDACRLPEELPEGFLIMFNAFHHFKPAEAQRILEQAVERGLPIAILEPNDRSLWQLIANTLSLPILQFLVTPFLRPFQWKRVLFTYIIPTIPLCTLWDGWVSVLRTYTPHEMEGIVKKADPKALFEWKLGKERHPFGKVNYLIGMPAASRQLF